MKKQRKDKSVFVRIGDELRLLIEDYARRYRISQSEVVRQALIRMFESSIK